MIGWGHGLGREGWVRGVEVGGGGGLGSGELGSGGWGQEFATGDK